MNKYVNKYLNTYLNKYKNIYLNKYLLTGFFCCLFIFFSILLYSFFKQNNHINFQLVQKNIAKAQQEAKKQNDILSQKIQKNGLIVLEATKLLQKYPFLVFRNKNLVYWQDAQYTFEYSQLRHTKESDFLDFLQGKLLTERKTLIYDSDTIQVYSFVSLVKNFSVQNQYLKPIYNTDLGISEKINISPLTPKGGTNNVQPIKGESPSAPKGGDKLFEIKNDKNQVIALLGENTQNNSTNPIKNNAKSNHFLRITILLFIFGFLWFFLIWDWKGGILQKNILKKILNFFPKKDSPKSIFYSLFFTILASAWVFCYAYFLKNWIHAEYKLDITQEIEFSWENTLVMGIYMAVSLPFFYVWHKIIRFDYALFSKNNNLKNKNLILNNKNFKNIIFNYLFNGTFLIICLVFFYFWTKNHSYFWILLLHLCLFWVCQYTKIARNLRKFNYLASIYLFFWAFLGGSVVTLLWLENKEKQNIENMRDFASRILPEEDSFAKDLLDKVAEKLKNMPELTGVFADSSNKKYLSVGIQDKIKRDYLGNYFNQYNIKMLFFDKYGNAVLGSPNAEGNFEYYQKTYQKTSYETENPAIWHIQKAGANAQKRYLTFVDYPNDHHLVLDIVQKRQSDSYVFSTLLLSKSHNLPALTRFYSYAVYDNKQLAYSVGDFNYEKEPFGQMFSKEILYLEGISYKNHVHFALQGGFKKVILVSCPLPTLSEYFSLFSFWFLNLALAIFIGLGAYTFFQNQQRHEIKFATRIQIYMNIAFFLPLLTISVVMWSILQNDYKIEFEKNFSNQTHQITRQLSNPLQDFKNKKIEKSQFTQILQDISEFSELDISVFDEKGKLLTTSQSSIYEKNILSPYININALYAIKQEKNKDIILSENIGTLQYQSAYVPIKYPQNDRIELAGIISIPFFDAQTKLHQKLLHSFANILNVFVSVFVVFLFLSYWASQILTSPLQKITAQIKKTSFYQENYYEELTWSAKTDEIGVFVQEYNKMLKNLEQSKRKMAIVQKEGAWKEIAKQVAHEINNPLTPMKLGLQLMQQRMKDQTETVQRTFERTIVMLLEQIDVLHNIAKSFSVFAKMPIPIEERFDMIYMLKSIQELYQNEFYIKWHFPTEKKMFVMGDKEILNSVMVNLIKNAIEATEHTAEQDRKRQILVQINCETDGILIIEVQDNGVGIPTDFLDKIFLPNFTTKQTGSGIGLALAKRSVEHAHGRIWVESAEGEGATFFIELPLVE